MRLRSGREYLITSVNFTSRGAFGTRVLGRTIQVRDGKGLLLVLSVMHSVSSTMEGGLSSCAAVATMGRAGPIQWRHHRQECHTNTMLDSSPNRLLNETLRSRGIETHFDANFRNLAIITESGGRVCCSADSIEHGQITPSHSKSFWLHVSARLAFIGLWTGNLFRVQGDHKDCAELAEHLFSEVSIDGPLTELPSGAVDRWGLKQVTVYEAHPKAGIGLLKDARERQHNVCFDFDAVKTQLTSIADSVELFAEHTVEFSSGAVSGLANVCFNGTAIGFLLNDSEESRLMHMAFLASASSRLVCDVYDPNWETLIDWRDPYYFKPEFFKAIPARVLKYQEEILDRLGRSL